MQSGIELCTVVPAMTKIFHSNPNEPIDYDENKALLDWSLSPFYER